jgi:thiol-disulfide isomerase/thioredoxin
MFAAVTLRLWRDRRGLQEELADARTEIAAIPQGLPVGAVAPGFALPNLQGAIQTLESLLAPGRPLALVFIAPDCGPCHAMLPELGRWQTALADRLTLAVVSRGTVADNDPLAKEHGIANLLIQEDMEVMDAFLTRGTPSALIVAPNGVIGSALHTSTFNIEQLIRFTVRPAPAVGEVGPVTAEPPVT